MATKGMKYEYKIVDLPDDGTEADITKLLNDLGAEGWWIISVAHGTHYDEQAWGTAFLVRVI